MGPEGSLLSSQDFSTGPFTEPDASNPQPHTYFFKIILILASHLHLGLQCGVLHGSVMIPLENRLPVSFGFGLYRPTGILPSVLLLNHSSKCLSKNKACLTKETFSVAHTFHALNLTNLHKNERRKHCLLFKNV
jgi:hypothetical protein